MLNRILFLTITLLLSFSTRCMVKGFEPASKEEPIIITEVSIIEPVIDRLELIAFAKQYMGTTYIHGSIDPDKGFDCSGFVYFVFRQFQIDVPRSSRDYESLGIALQPEDFKVGDVLVFYGYMDYTSIGHVGIICEANGMKSRFIHATSGKAYGVTVSDLDSKGYSHRFYKCVDVIRSRDVLR